jgi:hypothetical protein
VPHAAPRFRAFTDAEAQQSLVHLSFKHPTPPVKTPREYLDYLKESLFQVAFNARLFRLGRRQDPPFFAATVGGRLLPVSLSLLLVLFIIISVNARFAASALGALSWHQLLLGAPHDQYFTLDGACVPADGHGAAVRARLERGADRVHAGGQHAARAGGAPAHLPTLT